MEWIVIRMLRAGRPAAAHLRHAQAVRGRVVIADETLPHAGMTRVARVIGDPIPPLLGAQLQPNEGGRWRLSGTELAPDASGEPARYGQVWVMEPAADDDLIKAEGRISELLRQIEALQARLAEGSGG